MRKVFVLQRGGHPEELKVTVKLYLEVTIHKDGK